MILKSVFEKKKMILKIFIFIFQVTLFSDIFCYNDIYISFFLSLILYLYIYIHCEDICEDY